MTCEWNLSWKFAGGRTAKDAEIAEENKYAPRSPRSIRELQLKVMRSDIQAPVQVKAVRSESLHTGIEGEVLASLLLRMFDEPIEKRGAKSARAVGIVRDEIVDVKSAAGEKEIQNAKARHGADDTVQLEKRKLVPFLLLVQDLRREIDGLDVGTQFTHDRAAAGDLLGRFREADSPGGYFRSGHDVSSLAPR